MEFGPDLIDIGGRRLNAMVRGEGPLLVLEGGGMMPGTMYGPRLVPVLAKFATVLSYDRAGLGASDPPAGPRTVSDMADDLLALLDALKLDGKAVLVGYSLSALIMQVFAARHPARVAGLVLFDPTPSDSFEERIGVEPPPPPNLDALAANPKMQAAVKYELLRMRESCEEARAAEPGLPKVPASIIVAGKRDEASMAKYADILEQRHQRLADLISNGQKIVAPNSQHATIFSSDPQIAIAAIRDVVARAS
ncbi:MAG TPA: alpha/beta hydrolase [Hyphomonadaceae bacterium]|jgi:pimeloyl-ACP methyl ester carboxylesterase|nr:alpha/beta hydrolase [Hyphomonadaceae bacterium]